MTLSPTYVRRVQLGRRYERLRDALWTPSTPQSIVGMLVNLERLGLVERGTRTWEGPRGGKHSVTEWRAT